MKNLKSSGLTALFATLAVIAASFPLGGLSSGLLGLVPSVSPVTTVANSAPVSAGTISLSATNDKGVVTWGDLKQEFTSGGLGQCVLTPIAGGKELLDLEGRIGGISSSAGFKKGLVGVYEFKKQDGPPWNASHCDQVDVGSFTPSETLGVHLGSDAKDAFGPLVATKATLQLVAHTKPGAAVATLVDAEGNELSTKAFSWSKTGAFALTNLTVKNGEFSGILLTVTKGSFSLKGATFDVASQADDFFCTPGFDNTFTNDDGVTVKFIGNADGSTCTGFGIKLGRDGDAQVHFIKPLDVDPEAQFIFEVPWDTVPLSEPSMLPEVFIDFEVPEPYGPNEWPMPFCPDYLYEEGVLVGMPHPDSEGYDDARADLDSRDMEEVHEGIQETVGTQFACVGGRDVDITKSETGFEATITDLIYLIGDARMLMR